MADEPIPTAPATLSGVKGAIASLESDAEAGAKTLSVSLESKAKSFYETHVPLFTFLGGLAAGALAMLVKLKL